jgi:hypothetical protein
MVFVQVNIDDVLYGLYFTEYTKSLMRTSININYKTERLIFISGLEYVRYNSIDIDIYLYTLKDFDRYMQVFKLEKQCNKLIYDKDNVIKFFKGSK